MARCATCNSELPINAKFCPQCSTSVGKERVARTTAGNVRSSSADIDGIRTISDIGTISPDVGSDVSPSYLPDGCVFDDRYAIEGRLGAGAMGVVYLANDQFTMRKVALKLISPALVKSDSARQRFIREGLIARDVRHSNIIAVYEVSECDGQVYLVMEYLPGETLRKFLASHADQGIPFATAKKIVRNILEGLRAAHEAGIVHRDLKPENIMLVGDPETGDCRLKILDFGIARTIDENVGKQLTTTSSSTGTPLYMAPEQKTAADTVGPSADLYAVTVIFYELLLGVTSGGRWGAVSKERTDLPAAVDEVIDKGLRNRPRSRYQTAEEYLKALDSLPETKPAIEPAKPAEPKQPDPPEQTTKSSVFYWNYMTRTQRRIFWAVCVVALIIFAIVGSRENSIVPALNISGRWIDEIRGTNAPLYLVDIRQDGDTVTGSYYDYAGGNPAGTISGRMNGSFLNYQWFAVSGLSGSGTGQLESDGRHFDIQTTGAGVEYHRLHKDHLPGQ